MLYVVF